MNDVRVYAAFSWTVGLLISLLAVMAWGSGLNWQLERLTIVTIFPLLGLIAFSLMWSHYTLGAMRRYVNAPEPSVQAYWRVTSYLVLVLILLHPALYWYQLYLDGYGLPPGSYLSQYPEGSAGLGAVVLGSVALSAFLLYELHRWYKQKPWWKYVEYFNIAAMILIFYHGLVLGRDLTDGWYQLVWLFYGVTFVLAVIYVWREKKRTAQTL